MSIPTGDKRDESGRRAAFISDLRALADLLENEPRLPIPYDMQGVVYLRGTPAEQLTDLFAYAELLDTEVLYRQKDGVCETFYKRGLVTYCVYAKVGEPPPARPDGRIVITSPSQVFTAAAPPAAAPEHVSTPLVNGEQLHCCEGEADCTECRTGEPERAGGSA